MGIMFSRFKKKKSALEALEKLENEIKETEENKCYVEIQQKRITKFLYGCSVGICLICCFIFYSQFSSSNLKLHYLVPLAFSPILLLIPSKLITWYYVRLIKKKQSQLNEMKKEKKRILEEVMDKETYKVAKEILDKFSTETVPKPNLQSLQIAKQDFRKRTVNQAYANPNPQNSVQLLRNPNNTIERNQLIKKNVVPKALPAPMMRLPGSLFPLNRSYMDRIVEYLVGDGPNNRYALICSQCHSHNGMALKEEFEYVAFKCCYCFFFNPARKLRPEAPKLQEFNYLTYKDNSDFESSSSEENNEKHEEKILNGDKESGEANNLESELNATLPEISTNEANESESSEQPENPPKIEVPINKSDELIDAEQQNEQLESKSPSQAIKEITNLDQKS